MVFVPTPPRETASPQAQDLANRIAALIADYQRDHPDLSARDVTDALQAAGGGGRQGRAGQERRAIVATTIAGLLAAMVGLGVFLQRGSGEVGAPQFPGIAVGVGVLLVVMLVVMLRRRL